MTGIGEIAPREKLRVAHAIRQLAKIDAATIDTRWREETMDHSIAVDALISARGRERRSAE